MARDKPFADIFDLFISDTKKVENMALVVQTVDKFSL